VICYIPFESNKNKRKKCFGQNILGHALYRGKKSFFTIWNSWVSKDAEFYVDFKNLNLYSGQNAPKKRYSRIKIFVSTQGAPYVVNKFNFLE
jgi:hypothetical protein